MKVTFNPVNIYNKNYSFKAPVYDKAAAAAVNKEPAKDEITITKIKKVVSVLAVLCTCAGILYFGYKKCLKNNRVQLKKDEDDKLAKMIAPKVDKRVLNF